MPERSLVSMRLLDIRKLKKRSLVPLGGRFHFKFANCNEPYHLYCQSYHGARILTETNEPQASVRPFSTSSEGGAKGRALDFRT
jgi:hypothetical protein